MKSTSTNKTFEIVVITAEESVAEEATTCNALFEAGLSKLHLRKPQASAVQISTLIREIREEFRKRIIVHEHYDLVQEMNLGGYHIKSSGKAPEHTHGLHVSRSFHSFEEIESCEMDLQYGFLSPVFDSLSKPGYGSRFSMETLRAFLTQKLRFPVFALGGIAVNNISITKSIGFSGAAVLGSIWQQKTVVERLNSFRQLNAQL